MKKNFMNILLVIGQIVVAFYTYKSFVVSDEVGTLNELNIKQSYINNIYESQDKIFKYQVELVKDLKSFENIVRSMESMFQSVRLANPDIFKSENNRLLSDRKFESVREKSLSDFDELSRLQMEISRNIHNIEMVYSYILANQLYKKIDKKNTLMSSFHMFLYHKKETFQYMNDSRRKIKNVLFKGEFQAFLNISQFSPLGLKSSAPNFLEFMQNNIDKEDFIKVQNEINELFQKTNDLKDIKLNNELNSTQNLLYYYERIQ